ncbi:phage holin family protein [Halodesulfovibrio marinisediminis]|uniref:Putative Holin-X, holin superfamily III n=1 Tax=Halodesulfovibrio marinisediminis DSM 17456 TaxID=1121457 RepID=A0A1N6E991_9BACT|nr:phage holin family protein [Halodesulfovibrio marinisediminis]SIN79615.1 Putative Holin-X, holin superfamily III [Halodesulfovibrio marinisediminis DSM 17456]
MNDSMNKIQILLRSEVALFRLQTRRMAREAAFKIAALILALLALGMFTFAVYLGLSKLYGSTIAALLVALIDGLLALLLLLISQQIKSNTEQEKVIKEVRDIACKGLNADFEKVKAEVGEVTSDVRRIHDNVAGILAGSTSLITSITPVLGLFAAAVKKSREKGAS